MEDTNRLKQSFLNGIKQIESGLDQLLRNWYALEANGIDPYEWKRANVEYPFDEDLETMLRLVANYRNAVESDINITATTNIKDVKAAKSSPTLHSLFDELDDRFSFDLADEFEIHLDTTTSEIKCFTVDSHVFGNGAGLVYDVVVAVPMDDAHWEIAKDIERNLDRYILDQVAGSDYDGWVEDPNWDVDTYSIPDEISDTCKLYTYAICVVPFSNVGPYGEYGIDAGIANDED